MTQKQKKTQKNEMKVIKRNGKKVGVNFNKIRDRIKKQTYGLDTNFIDAIEVSQKVIKGLHDDITTVALDKLAAETCAGMVKDHPDYSILASRIELTALYKETSKSFVETMEKAFKNISPVTGKAAPLISQETLDLTHKYADELDAAIDYNRDLLIDYFGFKTLERSYLFKENGKKIIERPQHMWMRVALGIWKDNIKNVLKLYDFMSQKKYTHATPTLFNSGTNHPQLSSCFLLMNKEDSLEGIFGTLTDSARISKWSGGIGLALHNVRGDGAYIGGTGGFSDGLLPLLRHYNTLARYINQGGKRKGSIAVYLEPWHIDFIEFLDIRLNHGKEELRARDLFTAVWMNDLFMERYNDNEDWTFFSPDEAPGLHEVYGEEFKALYLKYEAEGLGRKTMKARDVMNRIHTSQIETGTPYIGFKDSINIKSNQKNIGTIKSSNLCVAPETKILTKNGYCEIKALAERFDMVDVWNGKEWSSVYPKMTGENQPLLHVEFSNGQSLDCTPYHKFYVQKGNGEVVEKRTHELEPGDELIQSNTPLMEFNIWGEKPELEDAYNYYRKYTGDTFVPNGYCIKTRIEWFGGLADSCGDFEGKTLKISHGNKDFLLDVQLMLQTLGIQSDVNLIDGSFVLYLDEYNTRIAHTTALRSENPESIKNVIPNTQSVKIISVEDQGRISDTYCVNESKEHKAVFNGILTGNCIEIVEYTDKDEEAVCNLASIALPSFIKDGKYDFKELYETAYFATESLNQVIDVNFYPTVETKRSNMRHRPIGLGVQGLADVFSILKMPFDSDEAKKLNKEIFETIYFASLSASCDLAKKEGAYETFQGSPASQGILQYDMWENRSVGTTKTDDGKSKWAVLDSKPVELSGMWDFDKLKEDIKAHGLRNSLNVALMPTASTSQILGFNEAFEPMTANIYTRGTLSGDFVVANKYMVKDLIEIGMWDTDMRDEVIMNDGSIQAIERIPAEIRERYKIVWEIKMKDVIDMAADRGAFVCQTQSMNLFIPKINNAKLSSAHIYGWLKGLKTGMYYLRTQKEAQALKGLGGVSKKAQPVTQASEEISCSLDDPDSCMACGS